MTNNNLICSKCKSTDPFPVELLNILLNEHENWLKCGKCNAILCRECYTRNKMKYGLYPKEDVKLSGFLKGCSTCSKVSEKKIKSKKKNLVV